MRTRISYFVVILIGALVFSSLAFAGPGKPNFGPAIYADGELWGTKGTTPLPAVNENNAQSFDKLFVIQNSNDQGQVAVAEAAPTNPAYNGGRWYVHTVMWTSDAFQEYGIVPLLTSYSDIEDYEDMGFLVVVPGTGPGAFFQCPLLPVKEDVQ